MEDIVTYDYCRHSNCVALAFTYSSFPFRVLSNSLFALRQLEMNYDCCLVFPVTSS